MVIMRNKQIIERRIRFRKAALEKLYTAYEQLASGNVKSYVIDDRELTRYDIDDISNEITKYENELDQLEAELAGLKPRKAVGIIPRDW